MGAQKVFVEINYCQISYCQKNELEVSVRFYAILNP